MDPADIPLCTEYEQTGGCRGGEDCPFIHGEQCQVRRGSLVEGRGGRGRGGGAFHGLEGMERAVVEGWSGVWRWYGGSKQQVTPPLIAPVLPPHNLTALTTTHLTTTTSPPPTPTRRAVSLPSTPTTRS